MRIIPAIIIFTAVALALGVSVAEAQEPSPTAVPSATPLPDGRLIIELKTDPRDREVCVEFDVDNRKDGERVGRFKLCGDDDDRRFRLDAGRYRIEASVPEGWEADRMSCHGVDAGEFTNAGGDEATVVLAPGRDFTCILRIDQLPATPTPTPEPTKPAVVATEKPGLALCESGRIIEVPRIAACPAPTSTPQSTATPVALVGSAVTTIRPPNTGDGGLVE